MTLVSLHDSENFGEFPDGAPEDLPDDGFLIWLRKQRKRADPVGDLARDYAEGERRRGCKVSVEDLVEQLTWTPARDSFKRAVGEWQVHRMLFS